jgi:hypothetical protein
LGGWFKASDQMQQGAGDAQARGQNAAALGAGPKPVRDRLAREVDDGIDARAGRQLVEAGDQPEGRPQRSGLGGVTRERDHVMARRAQGLRQPRADKSGGAGEQHRVRARQRIDQIAARAAHQPLRCHDRHSRSHFMRPHATPRCWRGAISSSPPAGS